MELEFLKKLGFIEEEKDINKLKISLGKVEFDKDGRKSKIITSDLRYFWDGESFGLHISDCEFDNQLWYDLIQKIREINLCVKVKLLYISRTNLSDFVTYGEAFSKLEYLNVSENKLLSLINLKRIISLKTLIANLNPNLNEILSLEVNNKINEVEFDPNFLAIQVNRQNERVKGFGFIDWKLEGLSVNFIDVGKSNLKEISDSILQFSTLKYLNLGGYYNFFEEEKITKGIKNENDFSKSESLRNLNLLPDLRHISLNGCNLQDIGFLKDLPNLSSLDLTGNNNISNWEPLNKGISTLKHLFLGHCSIDDYKISHIEFAKCSRLKRLFLQNNKIENLDFLEAFNFSNHIQVFLDNNKISSVGLAKFLKLDYTKCIYLKWGFESNINENGVFFVGNLFEPGFVPFFGEKDEEKKIKLFKDYYENFYDKEDEVIIQRLKLILLGNTRAGKTTLYDILTKDNKSNLDSTHGINIFEIEQGSEGGIPKVIIKGYDFGGQDYYHSTHNSYFSGENTLYYLVFRSDWEDSFSKKKIQDLNGKIKEERIFPIDYWIKGIEKNCIETNGEISVELFQNDYRKSGENNLQFVNLKDLNRNRKLIVSHDYTFNFLDKKKSGELYKELIRELVSKTEDVPISKSLYFNLKALKASSNKGLFKRIEAFANIEDESKRITSLRLSHNTFEIFDFNFIQGVSDKDLLDLIITDFEKFNDYIFKILEKGSDGYFDINQVNARLKKEDLTLEMIKYVLAFMIHYEIIFESPIEKGKYICPSFLSSEISTTENLFSKTFTKKLIKYRFHSYFHSNIFTKLIVKFSHNLLLDKTSKWKYVLKKNFVFLFNEGNKDSFIFIEFGYENEDTETKNQPNNQLESEITPNLPFIKVSNHSIFGISESFISRIHEEIDLILGFDKKCGLNENGIEKLVYNKYGDYIDSRILNNQNLLDPNNKSSNLLFFENKLFRKGDFKLFLSADERKKLKMKKIFISYSKFDEVYKDEFKSHLATLKSQDLIETFDDRDIESGDKFDKVIKQKIEECDLFICLISRHFLNVKYIFEQEFPYALKHKKTIIPIIIRPCDWEEMPVGNDRDKLGDWNAHDKAQVLTLRPVTKNENSQENVGEYSSNERDYMWLKLIKKIREIIEKD